LEIKMNANSILADLYDEGHHDLEQLRVLLEIAATLDELARRRTAGTAWPGAVVKITVPHPGRWDLLIDTVADTRETPVS
jgi:hypothetical protein